MWQNRTYLAEWGKSHVTVTLTHRSCVCPRSGGVWRQQSYSSTCAQTEHQMAALPPEKEPWYRLTRNLVGPRSGPEKTCLAAVGIPNRLRYSVYKWFMRQTTISRQHRCHCFCNPQPQQNTKILPVFCFSLYYSSSAGASINPQIGTQMFQLTCTIVSIICLQLPYGP